MPLDIRAPAMGIVVGWTGFQGGRRVVRTFGCRRTTHLQDDSRKENEPFKNFEVHIQIKGNLRSKGKRTRRYIFINRVTPNMNAAMEAATRMVKLPRIMYSQTVDMTVMIEGIRAMNL